MDITDVRSLKVIIWGIILLGSLESSIWIYAWREQARIR